MAERANLVSRSRGREPYRRVRLYPGCGEERLALAGRGVRQLGFSTLLDGSLTFVTSIAKFASFGNPVISQATR